MSTTTVILFPLGRSPRLVASTPVNSRWYLTELRRVPGLPSTCVLIRRAIAVGCALAALGTACSSSGGSTAGTTTTAPATTAPRVRTTTPAKGSTPTTTPVDPLGAMMVGDIPGYTRQPDDIADTGPTNLAKAALDDVGCNLSCDARGELTSSGFVRGYQRGWTNLDASGQEAQNFVFLYQFASPTGAQGYAAHWRDTLLTTNQGAAVQEFTPPFVPGAIGLRVADKSGSTGIAIFAKGPYAVKAQVTASPELDESGPATSLAALQFQRLP